MNNTLVLLTGIAVLAAGLVLVIVGAVTGNNELVTLGIGLLVGGAAPSAVATPRG